jgi:CBS-domain-containing membrane protein
MRCEEIMKRDVTTVWPSDTVQTAARHMRDANVGFLPVCYPSGRVIGVVTDRDITVRLVAASRLGSASVSEIMTSDVVACRPADDLHQAEALMGRHHVSRMLCTDDSGKLLGIISLSDIASVEDDRHAAEAMREISERETAPPV